MSSHVDYVALEHDIVQAADTNERTNDRRSFMYNQYFVKFGDADSFLSEMDTHRYIAELAAAAADNDDDQRAVPRVANVYHVFKTDRHMACAIMEKITLADPADTPTELFISKAAQAVLWMQAVPPPPGLEFGPLGGPCRTRHWLFEDYTVAPTIKTRKALERFFNAVRFPF